MSDEDATRMLATCPQQVVRFGLMEFGATRHNTVSQKNDTDVAY